MSRRSISPNILLINQGIRPELLQDYKSPEDLMGEGGILKQLTKALIERCLDAEIDIHLQEEKAEPLEPELDTPKPKNRRNGHSKKTIGDRTKAYAKDTTPDK